MAISAPASDPLELRAITKRFGAQTVLDRVDFRLAPGTVHALLGENGAGKTTLMRVAFGLVTPDSGEIVIHGQPQHLLTPRGAIAEGLGMVHQHYTHVPAMTVAENVALGGRGSFDRRRAEERVTEIGVRTGLTLDPRAVAGELPIGAQQRLEIVKALARDARVLILDEPTAVLTPAEGEELSRWIRVYAAAGNAVVLITHKLREAIATSDHVTVLRGGRVTLTANANALDTETIAAALLGDRTPDGGATRAPTIRSPGGVATEVIARLHGVDVIDEHGVMRVRQATFEVRAGEITGVAGVEGSGQHELLLVLAGRQKATTGRIERPATIAFVPEDRHRDALVLEFDRSENVALKDVGARAGLMRWANERVRAERIAESSDVRGTTAHAPVRTLSGGNQQKLVLGRELADGPRLVVAENPTRGLDIRATEEVHARLREAAVAGAAIVVYSSDLDEVLALADRVLVMHAGVVRDVARDPLVVGRAMLGFAMEPEFQDLEHPGGGA